jgi:hypothetical protein
MRWYYAIAVSALTLFAPAKSFAQQNSCIDNHSPPPGTVPACGNAPGYFRPQTVTVSPRFVPERTDNLYAPTGPNGKYWNQYDPRSGQYGPREPNPYGQNGYLSPPRVLNHLYNTRIAPGIQRRETEGRR